MRGSKMAVFSFLNKQERRIKAGGVHLGQNNFFDPVSAEEIKKGEKILGLPFPDQLKDFYYQVGHGNLTTPYNAPVDYDFYSSNEILSPSVAARFAKGILEWENQTHWMSQDTCEILEPGDLPFFEIHDSSNFLIMKLNSDNPNAVWALGNIKIEENFEKFIWRLYYESPSYYGDIIEAYYQG